MRDGTTRGRPVARRPAAASALLLCAAGCGAPLGLGRPATVIEPGHWRVGADAGLRVAGGAMDSQRAAHAHLRELGRTAVQRGAACGSSNPDAACLPAQAYPPLVEGAIAGLVSTPNAGDWGLHVQRGLARGWEAGVRVTGSAVRIEGAWQFYGDPALPAASGWTGLVGAGWNRHLRVPLPQLDGLSRADAGRDDLDIPLLFGYRYYRQAYFVAGARYMVSRHSGVLVPTYGVLPADGGAAVASLPETEQFGTSHHVGGLVSGYLGIGAVFLGMEVAAGWEGASVRAVGRDLAMSTLAVRPSVVMFVEL